jgi:serine/threonine protein kinase
LIHRDVKPANVLISTAGWVFLADFGIARLVDSAHVTQAGDVLGTPAFFAPEQVSGEPVGPPADVYALGLVLLECLTGKREYDGTSLESAMARLSRPPEIPVGLSGSWRDVLIGMTSRDPVTRLSAAQVAARLRSLENTGSFAPAESTTSVMPMATTVMPPVEAASVAPLDEPKSEGRRVWLWVLGLVILAAVAAGVIVAVHNHSTSSTGHCHHGPTLKPGKLESDMQKVEKLTCH